MYIKNKRGQSTVEYILLVTAVIAVMIVFATNKQAGFQSELNTTLNTAASDMSSKMDTLVNSHAAGTLVPGSIENLYTVNVTP